jgi:hypothetical protein
MHSGSLISQLVFVKHTQKDAKGKIEKIASKGKLWPDQDRILSNYRTVSEKPC